MSCGPKLMAQLRFAALCLLALGHAGFAFILLIILLLRLWEGDVLVQCGFGGRPYVDFKCICGGTLPYICWISESFNGIWGDGEGMERRVVWQSWLWLLLSLGPAAEGSLLIRARECWRDIFVGTMSWGYLLLALLPDTLPGDYLWLHSGTALLALGTAFLFQFLLPWRCLGMTLTAYIGYYFMLSEFAILQGASRHFTYDWTFTPGVLMEPGSLVMVILEWTLAFGAITVVITYCCHEAKKVCRDELREEPREVLAKEGMAHMACA
ncbi:unnamed protein product [Symbiodinium sp. CCMP2592]|nr:unnamed protein product [Symbiodinium sp. CCMP2592]